MSQAGTAALSSALARGAPGLSRAQLDRVVAAWAPVALAGGQRVQEPEQVSRYAYFVVAGGMRAYGLDDDGKLATRYVAFEGELITSIASFAGGGPSGEFIEALEPTSGYRLSRGAFAELRAEVPPLNDFYVGQLEHAYRTGTWRLRTFLAMSAAERYAHLLEHRPELVQRLSGVVLASYMGITPESLSRIRARR